MKIIIAAFLLLSCFMAKAEIMDCLPAPAHLFTLGGNATACAAGVAAFDYLQSDEFQKILADNTKLLEECVADLRATFPDVITGRRGIDMSCALVVTKKDENGNDLPKTIISREYSSEWKPGDEPYYPVNDAKNGALYEKYKELAKKEEKVIFGGRLGEYKYYDMDAVIASALAMCENEL